MKKTALALVFIAILTVSCKEETKEKIDDAADAVKTEVKEKIDTTAAKMEAHVDTLKVKTGEALGKGAEKLNEAAEEIKK
ncbi:hypothetical protein NHF50_09155 [Flavobacterium sp. NRK F10]|uniref:hypothetical protein n=1 Tax=Flavobacterium sp. NRK F10 TaxID=2954931 RepID=UPI0020912976|nr:hypothetical protein [Flavobacterium sp. NRK F10]MCO6175214.1 hypothetical protein [Flavobacterium sp. NRK F10]